VNYCSTDARNLRPLPGVEAAGICFSLPMTGDGATSVWMKAGPSRQKAKSRFCAAAACHQITSKRWVCRCRQGRAFTEEEVWQGHDVIVVNEAFARRFFPGEAPIGNASGGCV